ncbi:hypothetical protein ACFIQF_13140 [Comamonas sp. J-3]|uniref:hypothetical protein n=1 Tax=Comamonas trifloxystrobinivorans TaxID=3350256 RepID=UPI00372CA79B
MSADDFQNLKDSIAEIGVQNPITLFEGMVLDGWHRYNAANEVLMPCPHVELAAGTDPRHFVLAQNKARRHVTQAQLAMATTAVYQWMPVGKPAEVNSALSAELPAKTTKELAAVAGVGVRSIEQAKTVQTKAAPEVVEAVKSGAIGLPKAAAIAQLPKEEQAAAIEKPVSAIKPKKAKKEQPVQELEGYDPDCKDTQIEEAKETIVALADENEQLRDRLATGVMDGTEEEKQEAAQTIAALREQVRIQAIELDAVKVSRDAFMNENAELKKQIKFYQRKLKEA